MKNMHYKKLGLTLISAFAVILSFTNCEREISDEAVVATFPKTAEIFTDAPVGLTDQFFESFDPATGANPSGFNVDNKVAYVGTKSIRLDVPAPNDPSGGYIGGIFRDRGQGRNLTGFDALTFWVKASTTATLGTVGFGVDFGLNKYAITTDNIQLSTTWRKVIIPIPDPSKLTQEKGLFAFSAGTQSTNNMGYTIWIDELRFEKLGNNKLLYPYIINGVEKSVTGFVGSVQVIDQLGAKFNLANGSNISVNVAPNYFVFSSSNSAVNGPITISDSNVVSTRVIGTTGKSVITAQLKDNIAQGSLTINAAGLFPHAPVPTRVAQKVTSLFSDAYTSVPVRHFNGFFAPFQTTQGGAGNDPNNVDIKAPFATGGIDNIINYTKLNFVSIGTYETVPLVNITGRTHLHVDINVREAINTGDFIRIQIETGTGSNPASASFTLTASALSNVNTSGWASIDIPLSNFAGLSNLSNLGQVFFISDATITDIWVDNVYFYNN